MRMSPILGAWIVALVLVLFGRRAEAAPPLTLEEVLGELEGTHPAIEVADREVEAASARASAARGGFDPLLSIRGRWSPIGYYENAQADALVRVPTPAWGAMLYAGYRVGLGTYPIYRGELQTLSGGEVRAGVEVPVWKDGPIDPRRAAIKKAKILRDAAGRERDATRLRTEGDAAKAYWDWVAAGHRLQVARELLALAERRAEALEEQVAAGAVERIKLVDNQRLVLERRAKAVAAEQSFEQASLDLSLFLRDREKTPVRPKEDRVPERWPEPKPLDAGSIDDEVEQALARRPDVAALLAERAAADVDVRLARNQRAPDVRVGTFVARDFGDGPAELAPTEWGIGVTIEMPLLLREARGKLREAKADRAALDARLRAIRDRIGADLRAAHVAAAAARKNVELAREQVAAAEALADAERTLFREGASDLVVVNIRELAAADAANLEIDAQADYQRARAELLVATGRSP